jgi:hypothetical protein
MTDTQAAAPVKRKRRTPRRLPDPMQAAMDICGFRSHQARATLAKAIEAFNTLSAENKVIRDAKRSRPQRWADACGAASAGLQDLKDLQEEYQEWHDNLPDSLQQGNTGQLLEAITELDIDSAVDTVSEADGIELPRGFSG